MMKKFLSTYKFHFLVTLALLAIAAAIPFDSYYGRKISVSELAIRPEMAGIAALAGEDEDLVLKVVPGSGYTGMLAETDPITLKKGDYRLQAVSLAEGAENYIEIYSPGKLKEDNTQGELLAREELNQGGGVDGGLLFHSGFHGGYFHPDQLWRGKQFECKRFLPGVRKAYVYGYLLPDGSDPFDFRFDSYMEGTGRTA